MSQLCTRAQFQEVSRPFRSLVAHLLPPSGAFQKHRAGGKRTYAAENSNKAGLELLLCWDSAGPRCVVRVNGPARNMDKHAEFTVRAKRDEKEELRHIHLHTCLHDMIL